MRQVIVVASAVVLLSIQHAWGQSVPASGPASAPAKFVDPVPHAAITEPYKVVQDLDELTARIDNLYRKPFDKTIDKDGFMQVETVIFRDTTTGHEIAALTRELCSDMDHGDLGRPAWTCDGRRILFMGTRGYRDVDGRIVRSEWPGHKYQMNADYTGQRALYVKYKDRNVDKDGREIARSAGIYSKYNILDPDDPRYAYYAVNDKLWRVTISDAGDSDAELLCQLATPQTKIIQDISTDRKLLIQDANADPDRQTKKLPYMPEIHLIDLAKKPGEKGHYYHHPFDYGLPEVTDAKGTIIHSATNNYQFHSLAFGKNPKTIGWNYGPMTSVGEPLGYSLDISNGLDGPPTHGEVNSSGGVNPFGQYESHGKMVGGGSTLGLYFGGNVKVDGKDIGGWGLWIRDFADDRSLPRFLMTCPGGHVAGGNSRNPNVYAAHIGAQWREKVKESDGIAWGLVTDDKAKLLCYTYSDLRGGIKKDRATGKITWSGMNNNDFRPYSSIPRPVLSPDATKLWFHSCMLQPCEEWVGMYVCTVRPPDAPESLTPKYADGKVTLTWQAPKNCQETKAFHVYRDNNGKGFEEVGTVPISPRPADGKYTYADAIPGDGHYVYMVTAEEWSTLEGKQSNGVVVQVKGSEVDCGKAEARAKWDDTPPSAVTGFAVAKEADEDGQYRLKWGKNPAKDLRHYNVYFSSTGKPEISPKRRIVSPPASMTEYLDWSAPIGTEAYYAITAVDRQGNESQPTFAEVRK